MSWTDERVDVLSRLWLEGRSASQIAAALGGGLTRNAVIGKVHRLGMGGRVKAGAPAPEAIDSEESEDVLDETMAVAEVPRRVSTRSAVVSGELAETVAHGGGVHGAVVNGAIVHGVVSHANVSHANVAHGNVVNGNTALALTTATAEAPAEAAKPTRAPEQVVVPMSLKVTIVELRESMCKWPIGDPSSTDFRYCGSPSHNGTPYCQHHGKLAYQPAQDRRRERDRDRRTLLAR